MGIIFALSSIHNLKLGGELSVYDFVLRKIAHISEYAILYLLWAYSLRGGHNRTTVAGIITFLYATSDEVHQHLVPTRDGKIIDVLIDSLGILMGELILQARQRFNQN